MKAIFLVLVVAAAVFLVLIVFKSKADQGRPAENQRSVAPIGVFAPIGEPSFEERYGVKLDLPMPESEFLDLLEQLHLGYYASGPEHLSLRNKMEGFIVPKIPAHTRNYDMSMISHSYSIYEDPESDDRRQVGYLALVRKDMMVVFVENFFQYTSL